MTGSTAWRTATIALTALFLAAILWLIGFNRFQRDARRAAIDPPAADGIVVLTGGAGRIEVALRLLADGKASRLLVSGVSGRDLPEILHGRNVAPSAIPLVPDDRITLGRDATDTVGNAAETASWARRLGLRSLIVVTAGYHMPRALGEITRELPGIMLHPVAVQSPALRGTDRIGSLRLLATEYDKYLAARFGLSRMYGSEINRLLREGFRP